MLSVQHFVIYCVYVYPKQTKGYSGSDLRALSTEAAMEPIRYVEHFISLIMAHHSSVQRGRGSPG